MVVIVRTVISNRHVQGQSRRVQKFVPGTSLNRCVRGLGLKHRRLLLLHEFFQTNLPAAPLGAGLEFRGSEITVEVVDIKV